MWRQTSGVSTSSRTLFLMKKLKKKCLGVPALAGIRPVLTLAPDKRKKMGGWIFFGLIDRTV